MDLTVNAGENMSELLQAQTHVWHHTLNFVTSMSLKCAVQLGIPEAVQSHGGPITLPELVSALGIPPAKAPYLHRLLRLVVNSGFLSLNGGEDGERYSLTPAGRLLLRDNPFNAGALLLLILDPILTEPFHFMSSWFRSEKDDDDTTPYSAAHGGKTIWDHMAAAPELASLFNEAMAKDSGMIAELVVTEGKAAFQGVGSLVDVAGGTGNMARSIAKAFPDMTCTVLDLPHVVSGLVDSGNLNYIAGDMFETIPSADAVLLKWIMHDWSDENCVKILRKCKTAVTSNGRKAGQVIIIDMVLGNRSLDEKSVGVQYAFDMEMMVCLSGKERNEGEWAKLFFEAGFSSYHINPILGTRALIQIYP